ncbi:MAG TPA: hypothetical protein VN937_17605 [Blastocatellia bacterium]|nr:hypothetical protein [Blastocatellia bacterium]
MLDRISTRICGLAALCALTSCAAAGEGDLFLELQAARARALAIETRANPNEAIDGYQAAADLMTRFLDQYPDGKHADEVRSMREQMLKELRALRYEFEEFQKTQKAELSLSQPRLPSECEAMIRLWHGFVDRFPSSRFAAEAREKQARWQDRDQEEIKRGFQVIIDEVEIRPVKGPSHQLMAGRPWDPEIFGRSSAPDPYALLMLNNEAVSYAPVARDSLHAVWGQASEVLRVSDTQEVTIIIRDRDVAEKAAIALLGSSLFTFSGLQAARSALNQDNDDMIGKWTGTIHDLIDLGSNRTLRAGDFDHLKVRVVRPK